MKRIVLLATLFSAGRHFAETWTGTLVDVMCKGKDLSSHTAKCAMNCARSGYGVVLSDGKFVKLDEGGNAKALAALKATNTEKDLKVKVSGTPFRWRYRQGQRDRASVGASSPPQHDFDRAGQGQYRSSQMDQFRT